MSLHGRPRPRKTRFRTALRGSRRRLAQAGLPGSAEGVHVVVMNDLNFGRTSDAFSSHTQRIVQIVKGPMGLARAANHHYAGEQLDRDEPIHRDEST